MSVFLKQKRLFISREFELTDKSLKVFTSKPFSHTESEFSLEELTVRYFKVKYPNVVLTLISTALFLCIVITICSRFLDPNGSKLADVLFYVVPFTITVFLVYATYENNINIVLQNGKSIAFYADLPTQIELEDFLTAIDKTRKTYLLNLYAKATPYLSDEQISNNLNWLWDKDIIDDIELDDLRLKLLPKPKDGSSIGFKA